MIAESPGCSQDPYPVLCLVPTGILQSAPSPPHHRQSLSLSLSPSLLFLFYLPHPAPSTLFYFLSSVLPFAPVTPSSCFFFLIIIPLFLRAFPSLIFLFICLLSLCPSRRPLAPYTSTHFLLVPIVQCGSPTIPLSAVLVESLAFSPRPPSPTSASILLRPQR
jgi:hypothetical protein